MGTVNIDEVTVNIQEAKDLLVEHCYDIFTGQEPRTSAFMEGGIGVGKSQIVIKELKTELAKMMKIPEDRIKTHVFYPSSIDESSMQGISYVDDHVAQCSTPFWWPHKDDMKLPGSEQAPKDEGFYHIVVADEFTNANIHQQQACYRIVLDYEIQNNKKMHDNVVVICMGNRKEDKTGVTPLLPTVVNRFGLYLKVKQELSTLLQYAIREKFEPEVYAFLSEPSNSDAHYIVPNGPGTPFPSHRSWERFNGKVRSLKRKLGGRLTVTDNDGSVNSSVMRQVAIRASGVVGEEIASRFTSFLEYYQQLPKWDDVMSGRVSAQSFGLINKPNYIKHAVMISMAMLLIREENQEKLLAMTETLIPWMGDDSLGSADMSITFIQMLMTNDGPHLYLLNKSRTYNNFVRPFGARIRELRDTLNSVGSN